MHGLFPERASRFGCKYLLLIQHRDRCALGIAQSSERYLHIVQAFEVGDVLPDMQLLTDEGESVRLLVRYLDQISSQRQRP